MIEAGSFWKFKEREKWAGWELNPRFPARQAGIIRLDHQPMKIQQRIRFFYRAFILNRVC